MIRKFPILRILGIVILWLCKQQAVAQTDSITIPTPVFQMNREDSIQLAEEMASLFHPYSGLPIMTGSSAQNAKNTRELPNTKQIRVISHQQNKTYFWSVVLLILITAGIRLLNIRKYQETLLSAFDVPAAEKDRAWRVGVLNPTSLLIYTNFVLVASFLISVYLQQNRHVYTGAFAQLWAISSIIIFGLYLAKFILHASLGSLIRIKELSDMVIRNTISVHNFLTLFLLPFALFYTFETSPHLRATYEDTLLYLFLAAIAYRVIRSIFNGLKISRVPIMYIFVYLCALEILPWFVLFKLLNSYPN